MQTNNQAIHEIKVNDTEGAHPVNFKCIIDRYPPDCGGADEDTYNYVPCCPKCGRELERGYHVNYCQNCGQKLYWNVVFPSFKSVES